MGRYHFILIIAASILAAFAAMAWRECQEASVARHSCRLVPIFHGAERRPLMVADASPPTGGVEKALLCARADQA